MVRRQTKITHFYPRVNRVASAARAGATLYKSFKNMRLSSGGKKKRGGVRDILKRKHTTQRIHESVGGGMSRFVHKVPSSRFQKQLLKNVSSNYYVTNVNGRATCASAVQTVYSYSILTGGAVGGAGDLPYVFSKVVGSGTVGYKTQRVFFESVSSKLMMTNQQLSPINVTLYDIVARRDTQNAPEYDWGAGITEENASFNLSVVGCTPFASSLFCSHFKILKTTKMILGQGQSHTHNIYYKLNKLLNQDILNDSSNYLRGVTISTIICIHGLPDNSKATPANVSTSTCALDIVQLKQIRYSFVQDNDTNFWYVNNLPTIAGGDEDIVDIGAGTVTLQGTA